jgi:homopolymeric O-antigen transport system ATP-binding protein
MAAPAVDIHGLSKRYTVGQLDTGFGSVRRLVRRTPRRSKWALRDVSFAVGEGEAIAIIGRNGAGKSTLLKILSRITEPTNGYADIRGRVGSLLEVGTGFHGELTGRENVFLNGTILGMRRAEVARKFDQIVEFSGVESYIDTPVKRYSSGMSVRLAFAVAAFLEPEVLIVDEVLAVGDAEFQKRCLGRMGEVAREGRTVLFVSHNMQAVRRLCQRAVLLDQGRVVMDAGIEQVVHRYLAGVEATDAGRRRWADPAARPGDDTCRLVEVRATDEVGVPAGSFGTSRPIQVTVEFDLVAVDTAFIVAFDLVSSDGAVVFRASHTDTDDATRVPLRPGRNALTCTVPAGLLNTGRYAVNLRFSQHMTRWVVYEDGVLGFDVIADHGKSLFLNAQGRPGVIAPILGWSLAAPEADDLEPSEPVRAGA